MDMVGKMERPVIIDCGNNEIILFWKPEKGKFETYFLVSMKVLSVHLGSSEISHLNWLEFDCVFPSDHFLSLQKAMNNKLRGVANWLLNGYSLVSRC